MMGEFEGITISYTEAPSVLEVTLRETKPLHAQEPLTLLSDSSCKMYTMNAQW